MPVQLIFDESGFRLEITVPFRVITEIGLERFSRFFDFGPMCFRMGDLMHGIDPSQSFGLMLKAKEGLVAGFLSEQKKSYTRKLPGDRLLVVVDVCEDILSGVVFIFPKLHDKKLLRNMIWRTYSNVSWINSLLKKKDDDTFLLTLTPVVVEEKPLLAQTTQTETNVLSSKGKPASYVL